MNFAEKRSLNKQDKKGFVLKMSKLSKVFAGYFALSYLLAALLPVGILIVTGQKVISTAVLLTLGCAAVGTATALWLVG